MSVYSRIKLFFFFPGRGEDLDINIPRWQLLQIHCLCSAHRLNIFYCQPVENQRKDSLRKWKSRQKVNFSWYDWWLSAKFFQMDTCPVGTSNSLCKAGSKKTHKTYSWFYPLIILLMTQYLYTAPNKTVPQNTTKRDEKEWLDSTKELNKGASD